MSNVLTILKLIMLPIFSYKQLSSWSNIASQNDIYVQRFVLYSKILWTTKKKEKRKQQKHFVHKQLFTICMCCSDFDSFLFQYSCLISFYWWLGFHMFVFVIPIIFSPNNNPRIFGEVCGETTLASLSFYTETYFTCGSISGS